MSIVDARSRQIVLAMSLLVGLASPGRADVLGPVEITLRAGEVRDLELSLGKDGRSDLTLRAEALPADDASWPEDGDLEIGFPEGEDGRPAGLAMVPSSPSGRRLSLRVMASNCCARGSFNSQIRFTPMETATGVYVGSPFVLPVAVTVEPGGHCGVLVAKFAGATLFVGLAYLFSRNLYKQSHFLTASDLARNLRPQMWGPYGYPVEHPRQEAEVLARVDRQLRAQWRDRLRAWLRANPFRIGLPGKSYEETFRLWLGKKNLSLEVVGQSTPRQEKGSLVASSTKSGVEFFAVTDENGRISGLRAEPEILRRGLRGKLRGVKLLDPDPDKDSTHAGWQI